MYKLLTKEFCVYIFYRFVSLVSIVLGVYHFMFAKNSSVILGTIFCVLGFVFIGIYTKMKKPKLATCLDNSGFFTSFGVHILMTISIGLLVLCSVDSSKVQATADSALFCIFSLIAFFVSIGLYFLFCKKKG
jgi:hypothetical protein